MRLFGGVTRWSHAVLRDSGSRVCVFEATPLVTLLVSSRGFRGLQSQSLRRPSFSYLTSRLSNDQVSLFHILDPSCRSHPFTTWMLTYFLIRRLWRCPTASAYNVLLPVCVKSGSGPPFGPPLLAKWHPQIVALCPWGFERSSSPAQQCACVRYNIGSCRFTLMKSHCHHLTQEILHSSTAG